MNRDFDRKWIEAVREALSAGELVEPPPWARERARAAFQRFRPRGRPSLMTRIRAALVLDSRRMRAASAAVRSRTVASGPWQLLYRGGDVDIDLMVHPSQDGRTMNVRGQAIPAAGDSTRDGTVELLRSDLPRPLRGSVEPAARSPVEPSGEFSVANLERGRYDVLIHLGARDIELTDVEI